jgi:hypothetical protein
MPYDPKRPRPSVDDDAPAPVEALLDTGAHPVVTVPDPAVPDRVEVVADEIEVEVVPEPVEVVADDMEVEVVPDRVDDAVEDVEVVPPEVPGHRPQPVATAGSDVPVVPAPEDSTANRAVMFAALAAAVVSLVALLLLRRRRR